MKSTALLPMILTRLAAGDLFSDKFSYNAAEFCVPDTINSVSCDEHEIPEACTDMLGLGLSLACSPDTWTMKVCSSGCANPLLCVSTTQSTSNNMFSPPPGSGISGPIQVSCGQLTVLSYCLIGAALLIWLIALLFLCCRCGCRGCRTCEVICSDGCNSCEDLERRVMAKEAAASMAREPLLAARPRASLRGGPEEELLATKRELALARGRVAALSAELNAAR